MSSRARRLDRTAAPPAEGGAHHAADIVALGLGAAGLITGLAIATHSPDDASWGAATGATEFSNAVGPFGANLAYALFETVGYVAWIVPFALLGLAWSTFRKRKARLGAARSVGLVLLVLAAAALTALALGGLTPPDHFPPGGFVGRLLAAGLESALGTVGAWIVAGTLSLAAALLVTRLTLQEAASGAADRAQIAIDSARATSSRLTERIAALKPVREETRAGARAEEDDDEEDEEDDDEYPDEDDDEYEEEDDDEDDEERAAVAPKRSPKISSRKPAAASDEDDDETAPAKPEIRRPAAHATLKSTSKLFHLKMRVRRPEAATAQAATAQAANSKAANSKAANSKAATAKAAAERSAERPAPSAAAKAPAPEPVRLSPRLAPPPAAKPAAPARSSDSDFIAPAAREVAATAHDGDVHPGIGTRATIARAVRKADGGRPRDFRLPPTSLLDEVGEQAQVDEAELMECARQIVDKCAEFGVGGQILHIHPGPVVTTYELKPDAGVKFSRICSLEDDLAMALKAETIRIDRIPGKNTVGIEVPNRRREVISFRELVESDVFVESGSKLTMILGKTIDGAPYVADLAKMPHLLIAGSTGSGKSVALNSLITSMLFKARPDEVKLIMVDPKMLELGMYKDIPHLLTPVVTNPKLASNALKWAVKEMENRYARLAGCGVRNIEQYNAWVERQKEKGTPQLAPDGSDHVALPFIVIVIDELADLMMVAANDVEDSICRLAQMARAVGIHLILATQRPSVDVITGVIKANLPARCAMRVASKVDSRTILDSNGAEQLLGKGDMLFLPSGSSRLMRLHGPYLSEIETAGICDHLRTQREPVYDEKITEDLVGPEAGGSGSGSGDGAGKDDELFEQAARIVVERGEASVSYLQRRLKVGYSRAARLVDMLEEDGIVGPADGSKAREVRVGPDYFAELDRARADAGA